MKDIKSYLKNHFLRSGILEEEDLTDARLYENLYLEFFKFNDLHLPMNNFVRDDWYISFTFTFQLPDGKFYQIKDYRLPVGGDTFIEDVVDSNFFEKFDWDKEILEVFDYGKVKRVYEP